MNIIRYFFRGIGDPYIAYAIYGFLFVISILSGRLFRGSRKELAVELIVLGLAVYACISAFFFGREAIFDGFKLILISVIALYAYQIEYRQIRIIMKTVIVLNVWYAFALIMNPSSIDAFLETSGTYLTMTLSLGLALSMSLSYIITSIYTKKENRKKKIQVKSRYVLFMVLVSGILFYVLTFFPARSSFLFPLLAVIPFALIEAGFDRKKIFGILLISIIFLYCGYEIFMRHASSLAMGRMERLFTSFFKEDRWDIWRACLQLIRDEKWLLIGGGTRSFEMMTGYYPHNIYIQMIGEHGILGIAAGCIITGGICIRVFQRCKDIFGGSAFIKDYYLVFFEVLTGLFYLWLSYMKSFTLYESAPLLIFIGLTFNLCKKEYGSQ